MSGSGVSRRRFLQMLAIGAGATVLPGNRGCGGTVFDDGNRGIPAGLDGLPERVIVVGAGIAGLSAAHALAVFGKEVVVVEGRERIGGRIDTRDIGGTPVDLGASWIHGPVGNPVTRLADCYGIPVERGDQGGLFGHDHLTGTVPVSELLAAFAHVDGFFASILGLTLKLGPGASGEQGIQRYLDDAGLSGDPRRFADFAIRSAVQANYPIPPSELALNFIYADDGFPGGDWLPSGGYGPLLDGLAAGLDVRLGEAVVHVAYDSTGVEVTTTREVHRGSHAVVTAPLGVLQAGSIEFSPALPGSKRSAIDALAMGNFEKVVLRFDEQFWPSGLRYLTYLSALSGELPVFFDSTRYTGAPTLVVLNGAQYASDMDASSEEQLAERALEVLAEMAQTAVPDPTEVAVTRWKRDPFSLGSYTAIPLGGSPGRMDTLAQPVAGRVLFAGEATNSRYWATVHGAMMSGIREAKRLLGVPYVLLDPLV